jgi:hypothetical protein
MSRFPVYVVGAHGCSLGRSVGRVLSQQGLDVLRRDGTAQVVALGAFAPQVLQENALVAAPPDAGAGEPTMIELSVTPGDLVAGQRPLLLLRFANVSQGTCFDLVFKLRLPAGIVLVGGSDRWRSPRSRPAARTRTPSRSKRKDRAGSN